MCHRPGARDGMEIKYILMNFHQFHMKLEFINGERVA